MEFNNRLYQLRKQKGLSQEELANKLNVSRQTVSKWEIALPVLFVVSRLPLLR